MLGFASWVLCLGDFFVIPGGVWYYCMELVHIDCCFSRLSGQSWYNSPDAPLYSWDLGSVPISTNMLVLLARGWAYIFGHIGASFCVQLLPNARITVPYAQCVAPHW